MDGRAASPRQILCEAGCGAERAHALGEVSDVLGLIGVASHPSRRLSCHHRQRRFPLDLALRQGTFIPLSLDGIFRPRNDGRDPVRPNESTILKVYFG